ncbi:hypothetical protein V8C86DRAFT_1813983, partial [Haematococcus lacustris]
MSFARFGRHRSTQQLCGWSLATCAQTPSFRLSGTTPASVLLTAGPHVRTMVAVRDSIELNAVEQDLFSTLLAAVQHSGGNTVVRCAGGWVRDKLLGKSSLDIDIALDNMLGKDFAELVNRYLTAQGKATQGAAVIQSNPEQSKHLETARMKINGLWVDLVNLRSETYAEGSRIPLMTYGTPQQDALRRDFTINSLFYNVTQGCVEDFTGKGLLDLRAGIIRTPLPARDTFMDDPLRALRAVRFGTRFGFELDTELMQAAASEQVCSALADKVSKERVGTELKGMFDGPAPLAAVQLLLQLSLFPVVFALPLDAANAIDAGYGSRCLACMAAAEGLLRSQGEVQLDLEERRFLLLAALLLPLAQATAPGGPKGKRSPVSNHIIRESIKWRAKDAEMVVLLHETAADFLAVYQQLTHAGLAAGLQGPDQLSSGPDSAKLALGAAIRRLKQHWRLGVLLAPVLLLPEAAALGVEGGPNR